MLLLYIYLFIRIMYCLQYLVALDLLMIGRPIIAAIKNMMHKTNMWLCCMVALFFTNFNFLGHAYAHAMIQCCSLLVLL